MNIKKLFHRHHWTYYGYTPYGYGEDRNLWGRAQLRECRKCGKVETSW